MHILHLSDLHFGTVDDASLWFSQLAEDLTKELACRKLAALIISGDIANHSEPVEYRAAGQFINSLQKEFGLDRGRIIMVPGNHDLHWEISKKKGYRLRDDKFLELRGGSWSDFRGLTRCANRVRNYPYFRTDIVGFRCARTSK